MALHVSLGWQRTGLTSIAHKRTKTNSQGSTRGCGDRTGSQHFSRSCGRITYICGAPPGAVSELDEFVVDSHEVTAGAARR